jgi:hypothetical protein
MCFTHRIYDLQHEGLHGGISTKEERSSMAEDTPAPFEPGCRRCVMGNIQGMVLGEVCF